LVAPFPLNVIHSRPNGIYVGVTLGVGVTVGVTVSVGVGVGVSGVVSVGVGVTVSVGVGVGVGVSDVGVFVGVSVGVLVGVGLQVFGYTSKYSTSPVTVPGIAHILAIMFTSALTISTPSQLV
jgi:hypothetical protein